MNRHAISALRATLAADRPALGLWVTLESPSISEMAVALGFDWVVLDAEHGHLDWGELVAHLRCYARSRTVCLIRVAANDVALIKRALDIGADGVVLPWIEDADQLRRALCAARYPLAGIRGIGAERATAWGRAVTEHVAESDQALVVPLIESVRGGANAAALAAVDGIDLALVGPADWSATAGGAGGWCAEGVAEGIDRCLRTWRAAGKQMGVVTLGARDLRARIAQGFRLCAIGIDGGLLVDALTAGLLSAGVGAAIGTTLVPRRIGTPEDPLTSIPPALASPRRARRWRPGEAPSFDLDDRCRVDALIGEHGLADGLCAALVTIAPGGGLIRHHHPCDELVLVLDGLLGTEVEGRRYLLEPGDGIVIPAGCAHRTINGDARHPATIHVALPTPRITRELQPDPARIEDRAEAPAAGPELIARGGELSGVGVRCQRHRLETGARIGPDVAVVDRSVIAWRGKPCCRCGSAVHRLDPGEALHVPAGEPLLIEADAGPCDLILTQADGTVQPLAVHLDLIAAEQPIAAPT